MCRFAAFLFFVAIISFQTTAHADMKAYSENGKSVILHDNGKWSYLPTEETHKVIVEGKNVKYKMYYDNSKWSATSQPAGSAQDYMFKHSSGKAYGMIISEPIPFSYETMGNVILSYVNKIDAAGRIIQKETRKKNGKEFDFYKVEAKVQGTDFTFFYFIHIDDDSTTQVITYTVSQYVDELSPQMFEFMNGFVK